MTPRRHRRHVPDRRLPHLSLRRPAGNDECNGSSRRQPLTDSHDRFFPSATARRLTVLGILGLAIGFAGVVVLSDPDPSNIADTRTVSLFLIFLAALSFALESVLTRRYEDELPIETMEAWSILLGAALMHAISAGIGESVGTVEWTAEAMLALGYLSLVASAGGFLIYFDLLERLGPIEINLVSYAAPFAAAVTGLLFLSETPILQTAAGFALICGGFVLIKQRAIRAELGGVDSTTGD